MPFAKISQVAHYVPDQKIENDKLSQILDTSHEWIQSRTGIESRFISFNENTSDLASQVALQLIEGAKLNSDQIDFIIVATITPDSCSINELNPVLVFSIVAFNSIILVVVFN